MSDFEARTTALCQQWNPSRRIWTDRGSIQAYQYLIFTLNAPRRETVLNLKLTHGQCYVKTMRSRVNTVPWLTDDRVGVVGIPTAQNDHYIAKMSFVRTAHPNRLTES